jgi:hypothetical protein
MPVRRPVIVMEMHVNWGRGVEELCEGPVQECMADIEHESEVPPVQLRYQIRSAEVAALPRTHILNPNPDIVTRLDHRQCVEGTEEGFIRLIPAGVPCGEPRVDDQGFCPDLVADGTQVIDNLETCRAHPLVQTREVHLGGWGMDSEVCIHSIEGIPVPEEVMQAFGEDLDPACSSPYQFKGIPEREGYATVGGTATR